MAEGDTPEARLEAVVAAFEAPYQVCNLIGFPLAEDGTQSASSNWSRAPCGKRYFTVTHDGVKPEGGPLIGCVTAADAISGWLSAAKSYAISGRMLYWRERPQIACDKRGWRVYSRFLITDRLPLRESEARVLLDALKKRLGQE